MTIRESIKSRDRLVKGISTDGYFKISVVKTSEVVRTAIEKHELSLLNSVLLGRALTAALLLSSELKGEERIKLRFEGSGPVGAIITEANRAGEVRGYVQRPAAELDYSKEGVFMGQALGAGLLTVSKILYNEAEPRTSTIQLHAGDITTDVAHYLTQSEQVPSAILLNVDLDETGTLTQAGGLLVQRLPDAPDEVTGKLQEDLTHFDSVAALLNEGLYPTDILQMATRPYEVRELDRIPVHFFCRCSKERFLSALSMLHYEELREMEGESQEMVCHFCSNRVTIGPEEIRQLARAVKAKMN